MSKPYDVGYGKPPKNSQFKPGQSGNPKGRPKKYKSPISVLSEPVPMLINGKKARPTGFEASIRKTAQNAIEGRMPAIKRFIGYCDKFHLVDAMDDFHPSGVVVIPNDYDGKKSLDELAHEQYLERKKNAPKRDKPEQQKIVTKVALESHFVPALSRKVPILELVLLKLKERALKDRHEGALQFFEKLELRRMPDLNAPAIGYLVVPEGTTLETTPLRIEEVEMD